MLASERPIAKSAQKSQVVVTGQRVARTTPAAWRNLDWEFALLESESVNAFALPGGKVAVYEGILPIMANEAGLASVLGHEVGHVIARHGAERIGGTMMLQLGLAAADIGLSNTAVHQELMGMLGLGATIGVVLPFSRANELEADLIGGVLMARAGYDPRESV